MEYEVIETIGEPFIQGVKDDGSIVLIPMDEANADYQTYLAEIAG